MESWLQEIFRFLPSGGTYYLLIGLISFLESLALVGIFVPGSVLIVFAGFLAVHGKGVYLGLLVAAVCGAVAGDLASFALGARFGRHLFDRKPFRRYRDLLQRGEQFFFNHGGKSVFLGRFFGPLRPFIPFIAGGARMRPLHFLLYALVSGILWGFAYPGLGYFFGTSWKLVRVWTGRFSLLIVALAALFVVNGLLWRWVLPQLFRLCRWLAAGCLRGGRRVLETPSVRAYASRHPVLWRFLADRFTLRRGSGLYLTTGFAISILFALLFVRLVYDILLRTPLTWLDYRVHELVQLFQHPVTDTFFLAFTHLGDGLSIFLLTLLVLLWLLLHDRDFSAFILLFGVVGGYGLAFLLKALIERPRPEPHFKHLIVHSFGFPSAHAFMALVFFGLVTYLLLESVKSWKLRSSLILGNSFLILLIGASRVFLGVHWLSDVLGGFALGGVWLTFLITALQTRRRYGGEFPWSRGLRPLRLRPAVRLSVLALATALILGTIGTMIARRIAPELPLDRTIPSERVLSATSDLTALLAPVPRFTETLSGHPLRPLSLYVFARREDLAAAMTETGWRQAPPPTVATFLERSFSLLRRKPALDGAVLPRLVDGRAQDLTFVRPAAAQTLPARRIALFWDLGYRLPDGRDAWGGIASRQTGVQRFMQIPLAMPKMAPEIDRERDALAAMLLAHDGAARSETLPLAGAMAGEDIAGNRYHTDGRVRVLWLSPAPSAISRAAECPLPPRALSSRMSSTLTDRGDPSL